MSPFFDQLEDQLRSAARARAGGHEAPPARRPGRRWLHAGLRAAPVLAAVLVALVVVGGALVLLRHHGRGTPSPSGTPPTGPGLASMLAHTPQRRLHRELSYIAAATHSTLDSRACRLRQPTGVSTIHGTPGPALVSALGVLRRPATPADRLDPAVLAGTPDVYAGHARRALTANRVSYYIVPARYDRSASVPSDRCFALQIAALHQALPKLPSALRDQTRVLQAGLIAYAQRQAARAPRDTVCLVTVQSTVKRRGLRNQRHRGQARRTGERRSGHVLRDRSRRRRVSDAQLRGDSDPAGAVGDGAGDQQRLRRASPLGRAGARDAGRHLALGAGTRAQADLCAQADDRH